MQFNPRARRNTTSRWTKTAVLAIAIPVAGVSAAGVAAACERTANGSSNHHKSSDHKSRVKHHKKKKSTTTTRLASVDELLEGHGWGDDDESATSTTLVGDIDDETTSTTQVVIDDEETTTTTEVVVDEETTTTTAKPTTTTAKPTTTTTAKATTTTTAKPVSTSVTKSATQAVPGKGVGDLTVTITVGGGKVTACSGTFSGVTGESKDYTNASVLSALCAKAVSTNSSSVSKTSGATLTTQAFNTALATARMAAGL